MTQQTQTQTITTPPEANLRLSTHPTATSARPTVRWTEDVVDNENMDKKKSKVCCIFHPQREFGEDSGSDSDSSSGGSSDEGSDSGHGPGHAGHDHAGCEGRSARRKKKSGPNAYEYQPKYEKKGGVA